MSGVQRWVLRDMTTDETVTLPYNPNEMSSPYKGRNLQFAWGSGLGLSRIRAIDLPTQSPKEWTWGGVILTKHHYDLLLDWHKRNRVLRVTDHLSRTFEIIMQKYDPIERLPTATRPWRADYTMTCLILKEIP